MKGNLKKITDLGIRFWDGLYIYNIRTKILSKYEDNMLSSIRRKLKFSGNFTKNEILIGIRVIEKVSQLGLNFEEISSLSKLDENETIVRNYPKSVIDILDYDPNHTRILVSSDLNNRDTPLLRKEEKFPQTD